jgi:serine protease inhibitor
MYESPIGKGGNMSHEKESKSSPDEHFITQVLRYQEGDLSTEELRALNKDLRENPERLAEFTRIHSTSRLVHETQTAAMPVVSAADFEIEKPVTWRRALLPLAACLVVMLGISFWKFGGGIGGGNIATIVDPAALDSRWQLVAGEGAKYSIVSPNLVRLRSGELHFASLQPASLVVETPHAVATAEGTRFYIGHHTETIKPTNQRTTNMKTTKTISRLFVLAGIVTMTNNSGTVKAGENEAVVAGANAAPEKITVQANSDFAFDLYKQIAKENEGKNLFFSPYSVSSALAMAAEGARGETAIEMGKVLRFPDATRRTGDDAQRIPWETSLIHTGMSELNSKLNGADDDPAKTAEIRVKIVELRKELKAVKAKMVQLRADKKWDEWRSAYKKEQDVGAKLNAELSKVDQYEIRVANALWGEKTYPFDPNYVKTISTHYDTGGGVFPVDFENNFEAERLKINGWVEDQTNDLIKDALPKGSLNDLTRLVLTNAIYFKGDWSVPFKEENTKDSDFTLSGGDKQQTPIMHAPNLGVGRYGAFNADGSHFNTPLRIGSRQDPKGHYPKSDGFAIVELPYKGDDLSMVVIAPNDPAGLSAIEEKLTPDNLTQWVGQLKKRKTHVYLPKFKMETKYNLGDTLQKMGMVRAFKDPRDPKTGAQFQGMTTSTDPMKQLYISGVFHKAFVEVNEKGTEAAAATGVSMISPSSMQVPFTPEFKADRPFVYLIREKSTGSVLFLGRMTQPNN